MSQPPRSTAAGLRPRRLVLTLLLLASLTAATVGLVRGMGDGDPDGPHSFGIASGGAIDWHDPETLARELDGYETIGAGWIRFDFKWSLVESERGRDEWARYDRIVDAAHERGLSVVGMIGYSPSWARPPDAGDDKYPPEDVDAYAAFAERVVRRYGPRGVRHWEIWNEPNLGCCFWKPRADAASYVELLRATYPRIKEADSDAVVIGGSTAPTGDSETNVAPVRFLQEIYRLGGGAFFDAWSHHPYIGPNRPEEPYEWSAWYQMCCAQPSIRSVMVEHGDGEKKIHATEVGAEIGNECCGRRVDPELQADILVEAFDLWLGYPWAGILTVYNYRGHGGWSLVDEEWTRRPAWFAFRDHPKHEPARSRSGD